MINAAAISEIIAIYRKHGWILRRILLTAAMKDRLGKDAAQLFDDVQAIDSDIDAAWFSRLPKQGGVAWEIRHLSETPYALLENIDENSPGFEDALRSVESRLRETLLIGKSA